jgi:hypothetical protein
MFYKINVPQIAHETVDGETFIINTAKGTYYVVKGYGSVIWSSVANGHSLEQIQHTVAINTLFDDHEAVLENFFSSLLLEELIIPAEKNDVIESGPLYIEKNTSFQPPSFSKYDDLQELIAVDPIHDVSESQGWPF